MGETAPPCIIQAVAATPGMRESSSFETPPKEGTSNLQAKPASSRCTRSQAAPDWTVEEMLILVSEVAALDEDWLKALSSYQKWKMISDNCIALDVTRSSNQCKRKWESLLADYRKISNWESQSRPGSYWDLEGKKRKQYNLPALFEQEVFDSMDAILKSQEAQSGAGNSDSEDLIAVPEAEMLGSESDSDSEGETWSKTLKSTDKTQEMASKLQENAELIHAILRGELTDSVVLGGAMVDLSKPNAIETEFARRQADELIKAFGLLVGTLDQFTEMIEDGECEGIRPTNSMAS